MDLYQKFRNLDIDSALIAFEYSEIIQPYFCYPANAKAIGFEGGVLYCFLAGYGEMVFAANRRAAGINMFFRLRQALRIFYA